jgi:hypothetical protein
MSTTQELVERLRAVGEWTTIIEQHRRKTDDPSITYVLKDGTRVHEDDSSIAKLAASLSRALEDAATKANAAAARLSELERENARLTRELKHIARQVPAKDMDEDYYDAADFEDGYDSMIFIARAALAGSGEK